MPKIIAERLNEIGQALFVAAGVPPTEAETVMRHVVAANLAGHDSHGIIQVPTYIERVKVGHIVPGAPWTIVQESPTTTVVDGHWGFGYVVNERAMKLTIEKAKTANVAAATVFRQGHIGRVASYTLMAAREGMIGIATADSGRSPKAVAPFDMTWLEIDTWDPQSLALIRRAAPCPIASLESVCGRRAFRPFFDAYATDVAIIDVIWNGFLESIKIASMAEAYEVNCAPHNYYGHLCSAISAHFCAVVPNFRVMEIDIDSVSWRDELFLNAPAIENGELVIPKGPGWGVEVNEAAVRAHPPRTR